MSLTRITKAILGDENSIITVSAKLLGEYGEHGVFVGVPCVVCRNGVRRIHEMELTDEELTLFHSSCETLRQSYAQLQ